MCLILLAYRVHPKYPFIFAANRDEFYDRPTGSADIWEEDGNIIGGKDLKDGGTWLGITRRGRFAAITNFRDPARHKFSAPSRGTLVLEFLRAYDPAPLFLEKLYKESPVYNGFNLIFGYPDELFYFSPRLGGQPIWPGLHGLSNAYLNTSWPKVERGKALMKEVLTFPPEKWADGLFKLLTDRTLPRDDELPATGVGIEWERLLSPIFITSPIYGTRSSTVIIINDQGEVYFEERSYNGHPEPWLRVSMNFTLEGKK